MANYGYEYGNPFGDPNKFTRSTGEDELNRYNQWMRSQPWWQQANGDPNKIQQGLASAGITVPQDFHIDEAGNFNQKSRVKRNLAIAGIVGGAALGGLGLAGLGPLSGLGGAAGAGSGSAAAGGAGSVLGTTVPTIAGSNLAAGTITGAGLSGLTGGSVGAGSILGGIGKFLGSKTGQAIGAGLSGIAKSGAANRSAASDAAAEQERLDLARAAENRNERDDIWKKIAQAAYVKNYQPNTASFSKYSRPIQGPTGEQQQAAGSLQDQLLAELMSGKTAPPSANLSQYSKPSIWEQIAGYASPIVGAYQPINYGAR